MVDPTAGGTFVAAEGCDLDMSQHIHITNHLSSKAYDGRKATHRRSRAVAGSKHHPSITTLEAPVGGLSEYMNQGESTRGTRALAGCVALTSRGKPFCVMKRLACVLYPSRKHASNASARALRAHSLSRDAAG